MPKPWEKPVGGTSAPAAQMPWEKPVGTATQQAAPDQEDDPYVPLDQEAAQPTVGEIKARPGGVANWFEDLGNDIKYGGENTAPGRALKALGAKGLYRGTSEGAANMVGGTFIGPSRVGHGVTKLVDPDSSMRERARGLSETIQGGFQTASLPAMIAAPSILPQIVPSIATYGTINQGTSQGLQKLGVDPDYAQAAADIITVAAPGIKEGIRKTGGAVQRNSTGLGKAAAIVPGVIRAIKTGNPEWLITGMPGFSEAAGKVINVGGKALEGVGNMKVFPHEVMEAPSAPQAPPAEPQIIPPPSRLGGRGTGQRRLEAPTTIQQPASDLAPQEVLPGRTGEPKRLGPATSVQVPESSLGKKLVDTSALETQPLTKETVPDIIGNTPTQESPQAVTKPVPERGYTNEEAARDTATVAQAKRELGPNASARDIIIRAQEIKQQLDPNILESLGIKSPSEQGAMEQQAGLNTTPDQQLQATLNSKNQAAIFKAFVDAMNRKESEGQIPPPPEGAEPNALISTPEQWKTQEPAFKPTPEDRLSDQGIQQSMREDLERHGQEADEIGRKIFARDNKSDISRQGQQRYNPEIPGEEPGELVPDEQKPFGGRFANRRFGPGAANKDDPNFNGPSRRDFLKLGIKATGGAIASKVFPKPIADALSEVIKPSEQTSSLIDTAEKLSTLGKLSSPDDFHKLWGHLELHGDDDIDYNGSGLGLLSDTLGKLAQDKGSKGQTTVSFEDIGRATSEEMGYDPEETASWDPEEFAEAGADIAQSFSGPVHKLAGKLGLVIDPEKQTITFTPEALDKIDTLSKAIFEAYDGTGFGQDEDALAKFNKDVAPELHELNSEEGVPGIDHDRSEELRKKWNEEIEKKYSDKKKQEQNNPPKETDLEEKDFQNQNREDLENHRREIQAGDNSRDSETPWGSRQPKKLVDDSMLGPGAAAKNGPEFDDMLTDSGETVPKIRQIKANPSLDDSIALQKAMEAGQQEPVQFGVPSKSTLGKKLVDDSVLGAPRGQRPSLPEDPSKVHFTSNHQLTKAFLASTISKEELEIGRKWMEDAGDKADVTLEELRDAVQEQHREPRTPDTLPPDDNKSIGGREPFNMGIKTDVLDADHHKIEFGKMSQTLLHKVGLLRKDQISTTLNNGQVYDLIDDLENESIFGKHSDDEKRLLELMITRLSDHLEGPGVPKKFGTEAEERNQRDIEFHQKAIETAKTALKYAKNAPQYLRDQWQRDIVNSTDRISELQGKPNEIQLSKEEKGLGNQKITPRTPKIWFDKDGIAEEPITEEEKPMDNSEDNSMAEFSYGLGGGARVTYEPGEDEDMEGVVEIAIPTSESVESFANKSMKNLRENDIGAPLDKTEEDLQKILEGIDGVRWSHSESGLGERNIGFYVEDGAAADKAAEAIREYFKKNPIKTQ